MTERKKTINLLEQKGLNKSEIFTVISKLSQEYKYEYPHIGIKYKKGEVLYYYSTIEAIHNLCFDTEKEVMLANAIYENVKDDFNPNEFIQLIKFIFRIIQVKSKWV